MASIFTKIVQGEIPSYKLAENEHFYAFLDINPLSKGHTLVIPKLEVDYLLDLDEETYSGLWNFARKLGRAIETVIPCNRLAMIVLGLEIPHAHIHLIPMNSEADANFQKPKLKLDPPEMENIAEKIRNAYERMNQ